MSRTWFITGDPPAEDQPGKEDDEGERKRSTNIHQTLQRKNMLILIFCRLEK